MPDEVADVAQETEHRTFSTHGASASDTLEAVVLAVLLISLVVLLAAVLVFVPLFLAVRAFAESVGRGLADVIEAVVQEFLRFADAIHI